MVTPVDSTMDAVVVGTNHGCRGPLFPRACVATRGFGRGAGQRQPRGFAYEARARAVLLGERPCHPCRHTPAQPGAPCCGPARRAVRRGSFILHQCIGRDRALTNPTRAPPARPPALPPGRAVVDATAKCGPFFAEIIKLCLVPALKELSTKSKSKTMRYALVQVGSHPPYHSFVARKGQFTANLDYFTKQLERIRFEGGGLSGVAMADGLACALDLFHAERSTIMNKDCIMIASNSIATVRVLGNSVTV